MQSVLRVPCVVLPIPCTALHVLFSVLGVGTWVFYNRCSSRRLSGPSAPALWARAAADEYACTAPPPRPAAVRAISHGERTLQSAPRGAPEMSGVSHRPHDPGRVDVRPAMYCAGKCPRSAIAGVHVWMSRAAAHTRDLVRESRLRHRCPTLHTADIHRHKSHFSCRRPSAP